MKALLLVPLLLLLFVAPQNPSVSTAFVLKHVTVIDVTADQPLQALKFDQAIVVTGNRITAMGQTANVKVPAGAQIVDGGGRFVIPGLWDMHVHSLVGDRPDLLLPTIYCEWSHGRSRYGQ